MRYEDLGGFCKYISNDRNLLEGVFQRHKIRFTQPFALNDPLDCNPLLTVPCDYGQHTMYRVQGVLMPSINQWYQFQLIEPHVNEFGVLSLTKNPISFDMWSRYANGHKGCLLELKRDFNEDAAFLSADGQPYPVKPVNYLDKFLIDLAQCSSDDGALDLTQFRELYFYTKVQRWQSEKEHRLVRPLTDLGVPALSGIQTGSRRDPDTVHLSDLPTDVIQSVTFGAHMSKEDKKAIVEWCRGTDVQFLQCLVHRDEPDEAGLIPRVELIPLDDPDVLTTSLSWAPQTLLTESNPSVRRAEVRLSTIDQLPYYLGYETLVSMMYGRRRSRQGKYGTS